VEDHSTTLSRRVLHAARHAGLVAARKAEPHAFKIAAAVSQPLNSRPRAFRDTVGWIALYTLFVGLTLWVYVQFIFSPPAPSPLDPEVRLAEEHDRRGAAGEVTRRGKPEAPAAAGGHGPPAAEGHGEAAAEGHGGEGGAKAEEGHGDAAPKKAKPAKAPKLPTPTFKTGKDAKSAPPKAEEGHGEGGGH
jgi:hypothetical protein